MKTYIQNNLIQGLKTNPFRNTKTAWLLSLPFLAILLGIGYTSGLLGYGILESNLKYVLPFTLFIVPALLEESVFRGLMIPRNILEQGGKRTVIYLVISTVLFVLWHPVNALLYNHTAIPLFLNPYFMIMVGLLGLACGLGYIYSKSVWVPIIIHWFTVLVWVVFLGGRNIAMGIQ